MQTCYLNWKCTYYLLLNFGYVQTELRFLYRFQSTSFHSKCSTYIMASSTFIQSVCLGRQARNTQPFARGVSVQDSSSRQLLFYRLYPIFQTPYFIHIFMMTSLNLLTTCLYPSRRPTTHNLIYNSSFPWYPDLSWKSQKVSSLVQSSHSNSVTNFPFMTLLLTTT